MARAIVRYSCNNTAGKYPAEKARKAIRGVLEAAGFKKVGATGKGTASWEVSGVSTAVIGGALADVMKVVKGLPPGVLDQVWTYCDE